jgi:hypothetical protein
MRLQSIESDGTFREFARIDLDAEHVLEQWLEQNPKAILEDGKILVIGRQVLTNLGTRIDLLGIDRAGDVVVVELKRDRTPRDTLAQALEYASFVEPLTVEQLEEILQRYSGEEAPLADVHRSCFALAPEEAISFNKDQRIVIAGQSMTPEVRQTAVFLRRKGVRVTCLEFEFFATGAGQKALSSEIVVGEDLGPSGKLETSSAPRLSQADFFRSLDENGRPFFERLFEFAAKQGRVVHWGTNGFSLNVDLDGTHVALCFGYRPGSAFGQSLYTVLYRRGGLLLKTAAPTAVADGLAKKLAESGFVASAGKELKCVLNRPWTSDQIGAILSWLQELEDAIRQHGLAE